MTHSWRRTPWGGAERGCVEALEGRRAAVLLFASEAEVLDVYSSR